MLSKFGVILAIASSFGCHSSNTSKSENPPETPSDSIISSSSSSKSSIESSSKNTSSSQSQSSSSSKTSSQNKSELSCGHNHEASKVIPATCTTDGFTEHVCLECGQTSKTNTIPKKSHDYSYLYATYSNNARTYQERKMCVTCGATQQGNNLTKANNPIAYKEASNLVTGNAVGIVVKTTNGLRAYPGIGYEFLAWSNGETNPEISENNEGLTAIFKHKYGELPILSVNLANGVTLQNVNRVDYKSASFEVENCASNATLAGSFKGRGNGSWVGYSGKSGYTIKLSAKANFMGMKAKAKKWNLIACKDDASMHINYGAYNMAKNALPGIEWQTETKYIQVFVNNEFRGVYMLTDAVKVEKSRINAVCEDANGDYDFNAQNPGFLIEYDRYSRSNSSDKPNDPSGDLTPIENMSYFPVNGLYRDFSVKYPDPDDAKVYGGSIDDEVFKSGVLKIKNIMNNVSSILNNGTYEELLEVVDINSMADMYCLHELFKNSDVGWSSFYIYKKPNENKIRFGPAWDFDLSATYGRDNKTSGKHISTKSLNGDPNINTNAAFNDIFVKATKLKNSENKAAFADILNERFALNKENIMNSILQNFGGEDNSYFSFALNTKKWSVQNYASKLNEELTWLLERTKWMLANNFVN